jgi:hypothetical protein
MAAKKGRSATYKLAADEQGKWRVNYRGQVKTVTTSKSSMRTMKKVVRAYAPALSRLANR